jgi:hypothetical protein
MATSNFLTTILPNVIEGLSGMFTQSQGTSLQVEGNRLSAQGYRTAAVQTIASANFNNQIRQLNLNRQLDAFSREIRQFTAEQRVSAAASGASLASKSFLLVMNDTLSKFERQVIQARNSTEQAKNASLFEARSSAVSLENQARAADFRGDFAEAEGSRQRTKSLVSIGTNAVTSLLGEFGNANNKATK